MGNEEGEAENESEGAKPEKSSHVRAAPVEAPEGEQIYENSSSNLNLVAEDADEDERLIVHLVDVVSSEKKVGSTAAVSSTSVELNSPSSSATGEPALMTAIQKDATTATLVLLQFAASVNADGHEPGANLYALMHKENRNGMTPLALAAQKGNTTVVHALLSYGVNTMASTSSGSTALLQAAHFGHRCIVRLLLQHGAGFLPSMTASPSCEVLQHATHNPLANTVTTLVEMANFNLTTPLMRAAQEGHTGIVEDLLRAGAQVNRTNRSQMNALMLASQRGHADICRLLIRAGAVLDAKTHSDSTALQLACKRSHTRVVKVLVTAGCELYRTDSRGRTPRDGLQRRLEHLRHNNRRNHRQQNDHDAEEIAAIHTMLGFLDTNVQRYLMRCEARKVRSADIMLYWNLLQQDRATVSSPMVEQDGSVELTAVLARPPHTLPYPLGLTSTQALLRTMCLPAPLVQLIASFLPLPNLWERSIGMLTRRAAIHPNETVVSCLDLIDEILEEGGWVQACETARVPPPEPFSSWRAWKVYGQNIPGSAVPISSQRLVRPNITVAEMPQPTRPTLAEHRRVVGFLSLLARHESLAQVLCSSVYQMPVGLVGQLIRTHDVASLVRRFSNQGGGIQFDATSAMDLVTLASRLCGWYWRRSENILVAR